MGIPGGMEMLIILAIVILLFGAKKIPDLAKGIGTGIKEFKKATKDEITDKSEQIKSEEVKTNDIKENKEETK